MPLTKDPSWQRHAKFFDAAFAQLEQRQLSKIRAWAATNLAAPRPTMFYMFCGPDFLYADAFYSKATTYVLSALEPPGSVPDLSRLPRGRRRRRALQCRALARLDPELQLLHHQADEDRPARQDRLSGTLPILYVFLARSGKTIRDVSPVALDDKGTAYFGQRKSGPERDARRAHHVRRNAMAQRKTLYYFSTDLSNSGVRVSGFLKFCETLAPGNSLLKSASYLLHSGNFSTVRDFLLANSATIIQDDSGIPLAHYNPRKWRFFPFGRYAGPIDEFPGDIRSDYAELFRRAQPMDFGIGYRWRSHESNLLLSVRTASDDPGGADPASAAPSAEPAQPKPPRAGGPRPPEPIRRSRSRIFWFWRLKRYSSQPHQRTLWLGTMKAGLARRLIIAARDSVQAATITMRSASAAIRSSWRGS